MLEHILDWLDESSGGVLVLDLVIFLPLVFVPSIFFPRLRMWSYNLIYFSSWLWRVTIIVFIATTVFQHWGVPLSAKDWQSLGYLTILVIMAGTATALSSWILRKEQARKQAIEESNQWVADFAREHVRSGGNKGVRFLRAKDDPLVIVANQVFRERRKEKSPEN